MWVEGIQLGVRTMRRSPWLGLQRLLLPVSYWRSVEFSFVFRNLAARRNDRILDVGSPKELAFFLARRRECSIVYTNILSSEVEVTEQYIRAQPGKVNQPPRIVTQIEDGRSLTFEDNSFDGAYSVSVIEHIPENGDSRAVSELFRVVKPGGRVVITVPFDRQYRETFVQRPVYERGVEQGARVFYQRHYDERSLNQRLVAHAGGRLNKLEIWGESSVRVEKLLERIGRLRLPLSPLEGLLAGVFLHQANEKAGSHPMAAFLAFEKHK